MDYTTKDSGKRSEFSSGMVRDTEEGKPRFDLLFPEGIPYAEQMLTRFANLMARGAEKYDERNWEKASGEEELSRYKSSALRHLIQWITDETDEDHAAAVMFNVLAGETVLSRVQESDAEWECCSDPCPIKKTCEGEGGKCCDRGCPCAARTSEYVTCDLLKRPHKKDSSGDCLNPVPAEAC